VKAQAHYLAPMLLILVCGCMDGGFQPSHSLYVGPKLTAEVQGDSLVATFTATDIPTSGPQSGVYFGMLCAGTEYDVRFNDWSQTSVITRYSPPALMPGEARLDLSAGICVAHIPLVAGVPNLVSVVWHDGQGNQVGYLQTKQIPS
jgi:hypothetical protein